MNIRVIDGISTLTSLWTMVLILLADGSSRPKTDRLILCIPTRYLLSLKSCLIKHLIEFTVIVMRRKESLKWHHGGSSPRIFKVVATAVCCSVSLGNGGASTSADSRALVFQGFCANFWRAVTGLSEYIFWVSIEVIILTENCRHFS